MKKYTVRAYTKHSIKEAIQEEINVCKAVIKSQPQYANEAVKALRIAETAIKMPAKKALKYIVSEGRM